MITIEQSELKELIREVVKEVVGEELLKLQMALTPYVSDAEMKTIDESFTEESFADDEFVDGMKWLGR